MFQAKTEERKLLPQRTESQESDHEEEPGENQKLNNENRLKDKVERYGTSIQIPGQVQTLNFT